MSIQLQNSALLPHIIKQGDERLQFLVLNKTACIEDDGKLLISLNIETSSRTFAPIVPAKPLYNAQIGRSSFFIGLCFPLQLKHSL